MKKNKWKYRMNWEQKVGVWLLIAIVVAWALMVS